MTEKILRERWSAATTSNKSERMSTMSAASMATEVPVESAIPSVAATRAGESLMPSPTYCGQKSICAKCKEREKIEPLQPLHHLSASAPSPLQLYP
jgi:hypothetical protein